MTFSCWKCGIPLKPAEEVCPRCDEPRRMPKTVYELYVLRPMPLLEPDWQPRPDGYVYVHGDATQPITVGSRGHNCWYFKWREGTDEQALNVFQTSNGEIAWDREYEYGDSVGGRPPRWLHAVGIDAAARALWIPLPIFCAMYTDRPPEFWLP